MSALPNLVRPKDFQRRNRELFNTYAALRYYLDNRHENGLIETGAVVETAMGLRVDPDKFPAWLLGKSRLMRRGYKPSVCTSLADSSRGGI